VSDSGGIQPDTAVSAFFFQKNKWVKLSARNQVLTQQQILYLTGHGADGPATHCIEIKAFYVPNQPKTAPPAHLSKSASPTAVPDVSVKINYRWNPTLPLVAFEPEPHYFRKPRAVHVLHKHAQRRFTATKTPALPPVRFPPEISPVLRCTDKKAYNKTSGRVGIDQFARSAGLKFSLFLKKNQNSTRNAAISANPMKKQEVFLVS